VPAIVHHANAILRRSVPEVSEHTGLIGDSEILWRKALTTGSRAPVLYLHGVPTDGDDWLAFLKQTGGLAPDLPGFGRSAKRGDLDYSMEGLGRFVEAFADARGLERVRLVVHDWGVVGLLFAMRAPERIERLVIIDAVPMLPGYRWHRVARIWRRRGLGELFMGGTSARTLAILAPDLKPRANVVASRFDQGTQRAVLRLYRSAPEDVLARAGAGLAAITCPALVLWGARDRYIPASFAQAWADALPDASARVVEGAGHWPWLQHPELVSEVAGFLDG
jgi:pimeloyl-ACP methyl ester carboxylesterase